MTPSAFSYATHVARNQGYIDARTQEAICRSTLLIAGCGIGSAVAIAAARMGFEKFILVDGDVVDAHNLNRQFYEFADVGAFKVDALKRGILRINPFASVDAVRDNLSDANTRAVVERADLVFDTVDFLDLPAILGLHDEAVVQRKPILTAVSVGFGALTWYYPPGTQVTMRTMMQADIDRAEGAASYASVFASFFDRLRDRMDADVCDQVDRVLGLMRDGTPCPASQVASGSFGIAALAMSMIRDILASKDVPHAPAMVLHSFASHRAELIDASRTAHAP